MLRNKREKEKKFYVLLHMPFLLASNGTETREQC